jgi:murein DD-endopeptidase MepM/ murein hydrolase activator NlpD
VTQGQALGQSGNTGYSFGVHLHFEVHLNGKNVDPMMYLP